MKKELNIEDIESTLKQFAFNASLGSTEVWDELVYEWLGQTLTIGFDPYKNEFAITLVFAGETVKGVFDALHTNPDIYALFREMKPENGELRDLIDQMVDQCRELIMDNAAEDVRSAIRYMIGC